MIQSLEEQDQIDLELIRKACKNSLFQTLKYLWDTIIEDPFVYNWHIEYLCNQMQIVGQWVINREPAQYDLLINVPPGTTKSTICSVFFHVWLWENAPWIRIISASHASNLAIDHAIKARDVFKSDKFQRLFPHKVIFKADQNNKTYYQNIRKGSRVATSVGGDIIGKHAHVILMDDLVNPKTVASELLLKAATDFIDKVISTRKVDKKNTPTISIAQRLHELDPTGHLLEKAEKSGKKIKHICIPADDSIDNISPKHLGMLYKNGLMDPDRMDREVLEAQKIDLGSREYAGQYSQSPMAPGGNIIKREWIKGFTELPMDKVIGKYQSWDTAFKKGKKNSHNVCTDWIEFRHGYYLDNVFCEKMNYPELKKQVIASDADFRPDKTLVEDKATGTPVMQELEIETRINFVKILPDIDKEARAHAASPTFESGNVYIRMNAPWSKLVIEQLTMFPNCSIKDIMDSVSQFIIYIRQNSGPSQWDFAVSSGSNTTEGFYDD